MSSDLIQQFKARYEALAGGVHLASRAADAVAPLKEILEKAGAERIALAFPPAPLVRALEAHCPARGIQILKPPFAASMLPRALDECQVGVTSADFAIAEAGALAECVDDDSIRLVSTLPRVHVAILPASAIVATLKEAAPLMRAMFERRPAGCALTLISGPSRSGDIEMTLTLGVHGPQEAHVIILEGE